MKHTKKRVAALLLTLAMVLSLMPAAFAADVDFPDMPAEDDPSYAAVKSAVDNEIMTGENGQLNLEGTILRSTVSKMVVTAFAAKGEADLSSFGDVNSDAWYAEWMAKANQMGIMTGTSGMMRPGDEVTLQEVAAMLVRALGLEPGSAEDLEGVPGAEDVAEWAIPWVAALVKAEYISDVTGANQPMTRGAFAEVIYKVSGEGNYVNEGEITEDVDGNIVITADGVSLKGITVKGDVIIADGVDAGSISLDGVTIEGRLVVRGGSSVELTNSTASATVIAKTFDEVTVKADNASDTGDIAVAGTNGKAADKVTLDMAEPNAVISTDTSVAIQNATGGTVSMESANVSVTVESGTLDNVVVSDGMESAKIEVAEGATIDKVTTNTDVTIAGEGTVNEKEGTGTVTDAEGNEVAGSDEPANVPDISDAPFTSEEDTTAPSGSVAHTHNYDKTGAKPYDATNHVIVCVDKAAVEATEDTPAQAKIDGCGAMVYEPHTFEDGACSVCGQKQAGSVKTEGEVTDPEEKGDNWQACAEDAHKWVAKKLEGDKNATCKVEGKKSYECSECHSTRTDTLETLAHTPVKDTESSTAATCVADGTTKYKCSVCDTAINSLDVTVSKETVAHTVVRDTNSDVPATCQAPGKEGWKCSVEGCIADLSKELPVSPNAHTFGDWTADEGGSTHSRVCTNAKAEATADDSQGGESQAKTCGFKETRSHSWKLTAAAVAPTCQATGKTAEYACSATGCTATSGGDEIAKDTSAHSFSGEWESDETNHWHACTNKGCTVKSGETAHTPSTVDGDDCTVCGYGTSSTGPSTPAHQHNSQGEQKHDATQHWNICNGSEADCASQKLNATKHTFTNGQACSCGQAFPETCPDVDSHQNGVKCNTCGQTPAA